MMSLAAYSDSAERRALAGIATALILSFVVAGCGSSPTAPAPQIPDSVNSITNMVPAVGTTLQPGQTVTFTGTAGYSLNSANSGAIVLVIQDQANKVLQPAGTQPSATVAKGSGEVTLSQTITLPDSGITRVGLFFVLAPVGAASTQAAVTVTYQVR